MRYLITGGAGFVGVNLVHRCLTMSDAAVTVLDSLDERFGSTTEPLRNVLHRIRFVRGDIRDESLLAEIVRDQDAVIHCAAQTSHALSIQDPILDTDINCLGSIRLLEALRHHNPRATVVLASTSTVVGAVHGEEIDEDHAEHALDIYSANHGVAEKYFQIYHHVHGMKTACVRLPNLYGPFGKAAAQFGFINFFIHQALADAELPVFGDGGQRRNAMYVEDAVDVLLLAARDPRLVGRVLLATSDEHGSVFQIAVKIVEVFGAGHIRHVSWPDDRQRIESGSVRLSSERLRKLTGWAPRFDLETGLRHTRQIVTTLTSGTNR